MTQKIKTSIHKTFSTGFLVNEADLRRMHQMMLESAAKLNDPKEKSYFYIRTEGGAIYEFDTIDEIFAIDNIGAKTINFLFISVGNSSSKNTSSEHETDKEWGISIRFEKLTEKHYSYAPSIQLQVMGQSRDWVVLTASELEERIRLTHKFSPSRYLSHPATPYVPLFLVLALMVGMLILIPSPEPIHISLEKLRADGKIKDAIDAIIQSEKLRDPNRAAKDVVLKWAFGLLIAIGVLVGGFPKISRIIGRPYVFLWGEYISVHQRRKAIESTICVVIILGVIVGIISTWASKFIGL
jgi:hypothetical protein